MNLTTKIILILIPVSLLGCKPNRIPLDSKVQIDSAFTVEQTQSIIDAIDAWKAATSDGSAAVKIVPVIGTDCSWCQLQIVSGSAGSVDTATLAATRIDSNDTGFTWININSPYFSNSLNLQDTFMHELGHAFGLGAHEAGTLMRAEGVWSGMGTVDRRTLDRFNENY